jgi:hypothetical protein
VGWPRREVTASADVRRADHAYEGMKERTQRAARVHVEAERWAVGRAFVLALDLYVVRD